MTDMTTKTILLAGLASALTFAAPAYAGGSSGGYTSSGGSSSYGGVHRHYCGCGHTTCGTTSSGG
jgi:hypothetical protein